MFLLTKWIGDQIVAWFIWKKFNIWFVWVWWLYCSLINLAAVTKRKYLSSSERKYNFPWNKLVFNRDINNAARKKNPRQKIKHKMKTNSVSLFLNGFSMSSATEELFLLACLECGLETQQHKIVLLKLFLELEVYFYIITKTIYQVKYVNCNGLKCSANVPRIQEMRFVVLWRTKDNSVQCQMFPEIGF